MCFRKVILIVENGMEVGEVGVREMSEYSVVIVNSKRY